ncbi:SRPBCC domain-containing protein [Nocardia abscessus]|uniref:SRPBCC domain-containing protein n=1 Tax=Nocardia abscessus TaxID=120957 RepID=A0ABS0C9T8_9NOCA|nr:SRPBCC domain-containing protein [Nocardia abscessus]MBF6226941.1 SRPBCC domain-containing protein [Nocardia abscessus]
MAHTYVEPTGTGETTAHSDTYHGRFTRLVPHERVVRILEFEIGEPASADKQTTTYTLHDAETGTDVDAVHHGLPNAIAPEDNEPGPAELATMTEAAR